MAESADAEREPAAAPVSDAARVADAFATLDAPLAFASMIGNRAMSTLARQAGGGEVPPAAARPLAAWPTARGRSARMLARNGNDRGGPGSGGPTYEIQNNQVRLFRAMEGPEADSLHRFGDFNPSPNGAGKYFAFSEADARAFARAQLGTDANVTIVVTTVPKGFVPSSPGVRTSQSRPYIDRNGQASMQTGEVYTFYDPKGGGWSMHVDDEALPILNDSMTRPRILQSPVPSVGRPSTPPPPSGGGGSGPPPGDPKKPPPNETPVQPKIQSTDPKGTGQTRGAAVLGAAALAFSALNAIGDAIQAADARSAWKSQEPNVRKVLQEQPWLGAMVVFRWSQVDAPAFSLNKPGRHFEGVEVFFAETPADARNQERSAGVLMPGGEGRTFSSDRSWIEPPTPGSKPKPAAQAPAAPAPPVDVETDIGDKVAKNRWPELAVTLYDRFYGEALDKKVATDARLNGRLADLMHGALKAMILWAPPFRVADAVTKADPKAARQGRIDYILELTATDRSSRPADKGAEHWMRAARTLDGFTSDADLSGYLGTNIEMLKPIRAEAVKASLQRVVAAIDDIRANGHNWID
jgi:hypothetical protein